MTRESICPRCGHLLDQPPDLAPLVAELREQCHQLGAPISIGDTISEADLARLLDLSERTVRAWRESHARIPFRRVGRRVAYTLEAVAEYLARDRR